MTTETEKIIEIVEEDMNYVLNDFETEFVTRVIQEARKQALSENHCIKCNLNIADECNPCILKREKETAEAIKQIIRSMTSKSEGMKISSTILLEKIEKYLGQDTCEPSQDGLSGNAKRPDTNSPQTKPSVQSDEQRGREQSQGSHQPSKDKTADAREGCGKDVFDLDGNFFAVCDNEFAICSECSGEKK